MNKRALIVVDVQKDFLPGGALPVPDGDAVVEPINKLMALFDLVVLTADWHPESHQSFARRHEGKQPFDVVQVYYGAQVLWPEHCVSGTDGAQFAPGLDTTQAAMILRKGRRADCDSYSAFKEADRISETGLRSWLISQGVDCVYICGLATDFCVSWTALDAKQAGFKTYVVEDACRAIDLEGSLRAAHNSWQECGIERIDTSTLIEQYKNNDL